MYQLWFDATAAANVWMLPKHNLPVSVHQTLPHYVSINVWATAAAYGLVWRTAAWLCPKRDLLAWFDLHWLIMAVWQPWAGHPAPPVTCELQPLHAVRTHAMVSVTWWCDVAMHHISRHGKCKNVANQWSQGSLSELHLQTLYQVVVVVFLFFFPGTQSMSLS